MGRLSACLVGSFRALTPQLASVCAFRLSTHLTEARLTKNFSAGLLSMIVQGIYAVRPLNSRHAESDLLEKELDKWYLSLPEHLRYEPGASKPGTKHLPNVLTLHMQYWCAVLLLHRPLYVFYFPSLWHICLIKFLYSIRHVLQAKNKPEESDDLELRALATKSYELCNAAANHITSIVSQYQERYSLIRAPVFLCYYVFTASIMHDTTRKFFSMLSLSVIGLIFPFSHRTPERPSSSYGAVKMHECLARDADRVAKCC